MVSRLATITDAAVHLRGIQTLDTGFCNQTTITDAAFVHARDPEAQHAFCDQATITAAAFVHLHGIRTINTSVCRPAAQAAVAADIALGLV